MVNRQCADKYGRTISMVYLHMSLLLVMLEGAKLQLTIKSSVPMKEGPSKTDTVFYLGKLSKIKNIQVLQGGITHAVDKRTLSPGRNITMET